LPSKLRLTGAVPARISRLCLHPRPGSGAKRHRRGTSVFRLPATVSPAVFTDV